MSVVLAPYVYPMAMIAQTASVYLTVAATLERYFVVCWPLKSRSICTYGRAKRSLVAVALMALAYNAPRFKEYSYKTRTGKGIFP